MNTPTKPHFFWGHLKQRRFAPLEFFQQQMLSGQRILPLRFFIKRAYLLNHPDDVQTAMTTGSQKFVRGFGYKQMIPFMGKGLITSDGDFWLKQRRLMHSAFSSKRYERWEQIINVHTDELVAKWKASPQIPLAISEDITRMTIRVVCSALFGFDSRPVEDKTIRSLDIITEEVFHRVLKAWPWNNIGKEIIFRKAVADIREIAQMILDQGEAEEGSLLKILKDKMPADQAVDEVVTMFLAGFESSSATLTWALVLLTQHPQVLKQLQQQVPPSRKASVVTAQDLSETPLVKACIQETMRLYPAIWILARENSEVEYLSEHKLAAKSIIQICPYSLHRDPKVWQDPESFYPQRFIDTPADKLHKGSYIPFGLGPHVCIGAQLALMELQTALYKIVSQLEFQVVTTNVKPLPHITLRPNQTIYAIVKERV